MDQDTRNKLQRATQQVRRILEEEFAEQLEGTFDVLPDGKILPELGKHLDARQRFTRQKLVAAIEHIKAGGKKPLEAVNEYTREAAFTLLNRLVALRMLEARGVLQECVSKGEESSGFKEFCGLAPGMTALGDDGYRLYLECLFDELCVEIKVLFDRRDPASLLWPRRGALAELFDVIGDLDLQGIWREDETIGWVYQYFNSSDERKAMREESATPRNSRELAVRNQFFTPRYVVEFLTDNTLGRIWYEMQKGKTRLIDDCKYLVCRPCEHFLGYGEMAPADERHAGEDFSQEELLKRTVHVPHRAKKDPRDLKILDPACGSGHFLLYAFDLLITIYEEAWHDEEITDSEVSGRRLRDDFPTLEEMHAALPGLVLRYNLHGVDIDPRAAQIATIAIWMRGQRLLNDFRVPRDKRPLVAKSNIVCAEPMPGEDEMLQDFIARDLSDSPETRLLGQLVNRVFKAMELAGEAGSLLKIEEEISEAISAAKKQWSSEPKPIQRALFEFDAEKVSQKELPFDVSGIPDAEFWGQAELGIYAALRQYSEQARVRSYQRTLFAEDASRGFAFVDIMRGTYDVILMNPPFGDGTKRIRTYIRSNYPNAKTDVYSAFVDRGIRMTSQNGFVGAITPRTGFFLSSFSAWRENTLLKNAQPTVMADLGHGIMDGAMVEAAAYCLKRCHS